VVRQAVTLLFRFVSVSISRERTNRVLMKGLPRNAFCRYFAAMKGGLIILCACVLLTGCVDKHAQTRFLQRIVPPDDDVLARHVIELLRTGDVNEVRPFLGSSLLTPDTDTILRQLHNLLAKGKPLDVTLIGCLVNTSYFGGGTKRSSDISYQLHFPDAWVAGDVVVESQNGTKTIAGIHFRQYSDSLDTLTRFSLRDQSPFHYFVLVCCVVIPCFILYALVICIRTRPLRRKWLWILFILVGVVQFQFNWTTARWDIQPVSIVLLGAGYHSAGPYSPWVLDFGLPLGAMIFFMRRRKLIRPPIRTA